LQGEQIPFSHQRLGASRIIPQFRVFSAVVQFREAGFGDIPVKDASSAAQSTA
jgi:hypothetical protein